MGRRRFGAIRKLPSGQYQVRFRDVTGQLRPAPVTFRTKADADRWLAKTELELQRGVWVDPSAGDVLLADWAREYIATAVHLKPKTLDGYESLLRSVIVPTFGSTPIGSIQTFAVRRWVAHLSRTRGLSPSRVRQAYNLLGAMLKMAVADGLIVANPCVGVKLPRMPKPELIYLSAAQVSQLADEIPEPYGVLVEVLAYGGLRFGEVAALRRRRVDVAAGIVTVAESVAVVAGRLEYGTPKSHRIRQVVLPFSVVEQLRDHLDREVGPEPDTLVFTGPRGGPLRHGVFLRDAWRPTVERIGLGGHTPHVLRHTSATLLIDAGASIKDVQQHLGHSDAAVTLNITARSSRVAARTWPNGWSRSARRVGHRDDPHGRPAHVSGDGLGRRCHNRASRGRERARRGTATGLHCGTYVARSPIEARIVETGID